MVIKTGKAANFIAVVSFTWAWGGGISLSYLNQCSGPGNQPNVVLFAESDTPNGLLGTLAPRFPNENTPHRVGTVCAVTGMTAV